MNKLLIETQSHPGGDAYSLHRTALQPLLPTANEKDLIESCKQIDKIDETRFINFLQQQGLAPMWSKALRNASDTSLVSDVFIETLHQSRLQATGAYMLQSQGLKDIKSTFESENINHVIFKGCHIRELIYDEPAIRPACDIDVLISLGDQVKAIQALVNAGYQFAMNPENISHEMTLNKGGISIDLHWDIMRPGRTRVPMVENLLKTRIEYITHWGFSNEATLFLMLVHPVFTKYSTTPHSTLIRIVDLAHWIEIKELDREQLYDWLEEAGMQTAAWITLEWLRQLTEVVIPGFFIKKIQPDSLKTIYLKHWIKENYSSKFLGHPLWIQVAFTLPAHDNLTDAFNAIKINVRERNLAIANTNQLISTVQNTLLE